MFQDGVLGSDAGAWDGIVRASILSRFRPALALRKLSAFEAFASLAFVLAGVGILGCASHRDAASNVPCSSNNPRIYVLGDDLGERAAGGGADRALYLYCGNNASPVLSLSQDLKPYADGLDYDERGNVYVGEVVNHAIGWRVFDRSGRVIVISPPMRRFEDWAINRVDGIMYVISAPTFSLEAMDPSLHRVLRRVPLDFGGSAGSVSDSPSGLTFDRHGRFYVKYGKHVFAFSLQSGRLVRDFRIGSGAWTVENDGLFVSNGTKLSQYDLHDFRLVRTVNLLSQKTLFPQIAVANDGTVYVVDGQTLERYVAGRARAELTAPFNAIDARLAVDGRNNLYVLVPHNSAFSGNQVASTPGIYVYSPRGSHPMRVYRLPALAVTWSASAMVVIPSDNALAGSSAATGH